MSNRINLKSVGLITGFTIGAIGSAALVGLEYYETYSNPQQEMTSNFNETIDISDIKEAEDNDTIQLSSINVNMPSEIYISSKDYIGRAGIVNSEENKYVLEVELTLQETGESIYKSHKLNPNDTIDTIMLESPVEIGTHEVYAEFTAYMKDTMEEVTSITFQVLLHVVNTI